MRTKFYLIAIAAVATTMFYAGCSPVVQSINYKVQSVPEEAGMHFIKYTEEHENIVGPATGTSSKGQLLWYAAPVIALTPQQDKIAYLKSSNNYSNLYIKKVSGGKTSVQRTFNKEVNDMTFSPDGKSIVFTATKGTNQNIYLMDANQGAATQQVAASSENEVGPVYTPDGKKIFYAKEEGGRYYIWSIDLKSSLQTQYSEGFTPVFTADGKTLILTINSKDGGYRGEIWTLDIETGVSSQIMSRPDMGFSSPAISPDGKKIICVATTNGEANQKQNLDLYTFDIDGTHLKQITFHPGHDVSPIWTEDAKSVFFLSQRGNEEGHWNIWKVNVQ